MEISIQEDDENRKHSDEDAFVILIQQFYESLYKYAIKFTKNTDNSKDIVNSFFVHVWEKRYLFRLAEHNEKYIITSFKHFLIRHQHTERQKEKNRYSFFSLTEQNELPYETYWLANQHQNELKQQLQKAISTLPARQKQLVQLKFYEQLSYEEIAERTSLEVRTIYNKLHEAIKHLRQSAIIQQLKKNIFSLIV